MTELDLTKAIEEGAVPIWRESSPGYPIRDCDAWDECKKLAREVLTAAMPSLENEILERAAQQLNKWADETGRGEITGPAAIRRRAIRSAAQKILPTLTPAELAAAIERGEAHVIYCTSLDVEGAL